MSWHGLRRVASVAGFAGAFVWVVGLFFSAEAGAVLPSDASNFWLGAVGAALGVLLVPIALVLAEDRALTVAGIASCLATSASGAALMLGAAGSLGETAPSWNIPALTASLVTLLAWMSVTSYRGRDPRLLGKAVFAAGLIIAAALIGGLAVVAFPYTHTNGTVAVDALVGLLFVACVPLWLSAVSVRLWRHNVRD
jgi:hypothetical protein